MEQKQIKLVHTENYEVVKLIIDGIFHGLFTNSEAEGVARAFLTMKSKASLENVNIHFDLVTKEEMIKLEYI